ncbi:MAG: hypothetical protein ACE5FI_18995, partial [Anaerolineales bacterium]
RWALLTAAVAGYGLVMTPWFIRNFMVAGTPLAPGAARSVWLTTYEDLFRYPADAITPNAYLAQGIRGVARGKLWVLGQNLQTLVAVQGMVFLGPFMVVGLWQLRAQRLARMAVAYLGLLFFTMTFVFSFPGARGGLFHSGAALVPVLAVAAVYGVDHVVTWVAARRRSWEAQRARAVFRGGVVALAVGLTAMLIFVRVVQGDRSHSDRLLARVGAQLPAGSVVASNNPPGLYAAAGLAGVFIPTGTESTLGAVVAQYGVDYVLLDENHVPALAPLYARQRRPDYLCPPLTPAPGVLLFPVAPCD